MKRFKTYKRYNNRLFKLFIYFIIFIIGFSITIKLLFNRVITPNEENVDRMLAISSNNLLDRFSIFKLDNLKLGNPKTILSMAFNDIGDIKIIEEKEEEKVVMKDASDPLIYIYNTHQSEDYDPGYLKEYNITPTVYMAANILKKKLSTLGIESIVEDENIAKVLKEHNWAYKDSYYASMLWLEKAREKYPSVKYYLDLHRDSYAGSITINDIPYAKMMFVIGMNHEGYSKNEELMVKLNNYLNEHYPGLMRDILYAKKNKFNQHFDPNVMLIEVGSPKNNIEEVQNSVNALAEAIESVIGGS